LAVIAADTDVLIDFLSGAEPGATQIAGYVAADQLQTTAVTCFELLSGAGEGKRGDAIRRLLAALPVLPLDRAAAEQAAAIRRDLDRAGQTIGMADSLIAGIALTHGVRLFTRNRKHFERVAHLKLVDVGGGR
jgi:tRNA(fMet)-specific endonuclease VapC